jgi:hypothetical protein
MKRRWWRNEAEAVAGNRCNRPAGTGIVKPRDFQPRAQLNTLPAVMTTVMTVLVLVLFIPVLRVV